MLEFEDRHLDFVTRHWQEGKMDTEMAIRTFMAGHPELQRKSTKPRLRWLYALSGVAAALIAGFFLWQGLSGRTTVLESRSMSAEYRLPDHTEVTLFEGSRLEYERRSFGKALRKVKMEGRIFFDVSRDEAHPFEIMAGPGKIRVLGTQFEVDTDGQQTELQVLEGKVFFGTAGASSTDQGLILTRGMKAGLDEKGGIPELYTGADPNVFAWKTHRFIFNKTPLEQVLATLSEYYGVRLSCLAEEKYLTGEFGTESLELILRMIGQALDVEISAEPDGTF